MRHFSWTGKNQPLSEDEFKELASTYRGLHEMRYPYKYQRTDDKTLTGMYVTFRHYENVREFSQEQHERATELFNETRQQMLDNIVSRSGVLTFIGMGMEFTPNIEGGIGNYRIRSYFTDAKGESFLLEIHAPYNSKQEGTCNRGFYGELVYIEDNDIRMKECEKKVAEYEKEFGRHWWLHITRDQREEIENLRWYKYERVESNKDYSEKGILDYVNSRFGTDYKSLFYDTWILSCDDAEGYKSHC